MKFCLRSLHIFIKKQGRTYSKLVRRSEEYDVERIRNVGLIAHIDAGKTTTTERMVFYSGLTSSPGNIDEGTTMTDFMEQERERGITISSAVVSLPWKQHVINLIDTPGHIDFTCEVECALRVLDGAVLILDATAGVQAQTMGVWRQARRHNIPHVAFVNKMDSKRADFTNAVSSLRNKLNTTPLVLQRPVFCDDNLSFEGVVDLVAMRRCVWKGAYGEDYQVEDLHGGLMDECRKDRQQLVEELADLDDVVGERYLSEDTDLSEAEMWHAIGRVTQSCKGVPVLCGSSLRNKAVQPLLDCILHCLPSPRHLLFSQQSLQQQATQQQDPPQHSLQTVLQQQQHPPQPHQQQAQKKQQRLLAFAFKTVHTRNKQPITFVRLYSGIIHKARLQIFNHSSQHLEKVERILLVRGDEYTEMDEAREGMICALTGLKQTKTGDILTSVQHPATQASFEDLTDIKAMLIPTPVFFCSIEPSTLASQKALEQALGCLSREDPSLKVEVDELTGQTVLGGMGQLHLEVVRDRILQEFKVEAELGRLQIAYQESISHKRTVSVQLQQSIAATNNSVNITATFYPVLENTSDDDPNKNPLIVDSTLSVRPNLKVTLSVSGDKKHKASFSIKADVESELFKTGLQPHLIKPIQDGLSTAFSRGPLMGCGAVKVHMQLNELQCSRRTSMAFITSCVSKLVTKALHNNCLLLQPVMNVNVMTTTEMAGVVLKELSQRHSTSVDVQRNAESVVVQASTPLANLHNFATSLRINTRGLASFTMALQSYQRLSEPALKQLLTS